MKALFLSLMLIICGSVVAEGEGATVTCKIRNEFGDVVGRGSNIHSAQSDASTKCFDKRVDAFQIARGELPSGDQADLMIESCVNIRCTQ